MTHKAITMEVTPGGSRPMWEFGCSCGARFNAGDSLDRHIADANAIAGHMLRHAEAVFEESIGTRVNHYTCSCGMLAIGEAQRDEHLRAMNSPHAASLGNPTSASHELDHEIALRDAYVRGFVEGSCRRFRGDITLAWRRSVAIAAYDGTTLDRDVAVTFDPEGLASAIDERATQLELAPASEHQLALAAFARSLAQMIRENCVDS